MTEYVAAVQRRHNRLPSVPHDSEWPSLAIVRTEGDEAFWQPTRRHDPLTFDGLSRALEIDIPEACAAFYGRYWSASIPVIWGERPFELLQLWNDEDQNNLMHNLLGHSLEKKRVREPLTLFFALVDDARFLSIDLASGAVMLEEIDGPRPEEVAADLGALLADVTAVAAIDDPS